MLEYGSPGSCTLPLVAFVLLAVACRAPRELLDPPPAVQQVAEDGTSALAAQEEEREQSAWSATHDGVTHGVRQTAAWIDRFLSDERSTEEENRSWAALRVDSSVEDREGFDAGVRVRVHVVLPRTEEKLRLDILGEDDEEDTVVEEDPVPSDPASTADDVHLALRYLAKRTRRNHIGIDAGVRFDGVDPDPYAGLRWRHGLPVEPWFLRATERVRQYAEAGLESRTTFDIERLLASDLFFRATTRGRWREEKDFDYGQRFVLYQGLGVDSLLALDLDGSIATEPVHVLKELELRLRLSQRFLERKLLLEVAPQVAWREEDDFVPALGLIVRVELGFGQED